MARTPTVQIRLLGIPEDGFDAELFLPQIKNSFMGVNQLRGERVFNPA
jgi:hypothetical protein